MTSYNITARKTSPITPVTVEAASSEEAIAQVVASATEGEQIEILQCIPALVETPPAGGATGATGPASRHK